MKIELCSLLGTGLLAAVCSTGKTIQLGNMTQTTDATFFLARLAVATMIEAWTMLVVGCIPSFRPLMRAVLQRLWGTPSTDQTLHIYTCQHQKYGRASNDTISDRGRLSLPVDKAHVYNRSKLVITEPNEICKCGKINSNENEVSQKCIGAIMKTTDIAIRYDSISVVKAREAFAVPGLPR